MKPSLRRRYFGWLLLLLTLSYLLLAGVLLAMEFHESRQQGTPFREEIPEVVGLLAVMALTLPVVALAAWRISGRLLRPLKQVLATAEHIRQGHFDERIPPLPHADELARLAEAINDAFDRYAAAVRRLEHFSADASHQLRIPLTAIKSLVQVTLQRERPVAVYHETLGDILEQAGRLETSVEQLLVLARLDRALRDAFHPIPLAARLRAWGEDAREAFDRVRITLDIEMPDTWVCLGDEVLLREAFANLFDNALLFTPAGGEILIGLRRTGAHALEWRLEDSGPGFAPDDEARVFDRFYRGRQATHRGSGLGLAIVREIVLLHEGTIRATRGERLGGAAVVIILPRHPSAG